MVEQGIDPTEILERCEEGMEIVGKRFESGEYFVSDLIMAGEIFKRIIEIVNPLIKTTKGAPIGKALVGTVQGDIHDIDKNIVTSLLQAQGFDVLDLGVDVPPSNFVEKIKEFKPDIVGLSALLTSAVHSMKQTIDALAENKLRGQVKVIIGGSIVNEMVAGYIGADAFTRSAVEGIRMCKEWVMSRPKKDS